MNINEMWKKLWPEGKAPPLNRTELATIYNYKREPDDCLQFEEVVDKALRHYLEEEDITGHKLLGPDGVPPWGRDMVMSLVVAFLAHSRFDKVWVEDSDVWRHEVGSAGEKDKPVEDEG